MHNSKFIVSAAVAISAVLGVGVASAADLAARPYTKAPIVVPAPVYDWSGFYVGGNGGWGSSRKCRTLNDYAIIADLPGDAGVSEGCHDATGGVAGGQVGYRWQSSAWVFGLEAQGDWADLHGSNKSTTFVYRLTDNHSKVDAFGLFTGQVGYAWNNALLYVKGGAAVARDNYYGTGIPRGNLVDSGSETRWGGVVGVGFEYGFTPNWSFAVEYDHMFMGDHNVTSYFATDGLFSRTDAIRQNVDLVTARINYRFGGPVVARY